MRAAKTTAPQRPPTPLIAKWYSFCLAHAYAAREFITLLGGAVAT